MSQSLSTQANGNIFHVQITQHFFQTCLLPTSPSMKASYGSSSCWVLLYDELGHLVHCCLKLLACYLYLQRAVKMTEIIYQTALWWILTSRACRPLVMEQEKRFWWCKIISQTSGLSSLTAHRCTQTKSLGHALHVLPIFLLNKQLTPSLRSQDTFIPHAHPHAHTLLWMQDKRTDNHNNNMHQTTGWVQSR